VTPPPLTIPRIKNEGARTARLLEALRSMRRGGGGGAVTVREGGAGQVEVVERKIRERERGARAARGAASGLRGHERAVDICTATYVSSACYMRALILIHMCAVG
jgi:hypothetical protein